MPWVDYTWVELFPEMIAKAHKRLPYADFRQWDMTNPDDIPSEVDVAFYLQSLHHLDIDGRSEAAQAVHEKLSANGRVVIVDSFVPEVQSAIHETTYRAYAVWAQFPSNKIWQTFHALRSMRKPGEYDPADYWYHSPKKTNILGKEQSDLFTLRHDITPFWDKAISDILVFEKR